MDFKHYDKNNIITTSLHIKIKDGKKQVIPVCKWKNVKTMYQCKEARNNNALALAIITGKVNNITVLDCDTEESYKELSEYIPEGCVIVKTLRGYHIYFSYDEKLKNNANGFNIKDIDCRNDGGIIIAPPSQYSDKSFEYSFLSFGGDPEANINRMAKLPEIPSELMELLIKKKSKTDIKPIKYIHNEMNTTTDDRLKYVKKLVNELPIDLNYDEWRDVAWGLAHYTSKDTRAFKLFKKFSAKTPEKYNKSKCKEVWKLADLEMEYPITIEKVEKIKRQHKIKNLLSDTIDKDIILGLIEGNFFEDVNDYLNRHFCIIVGQDKSLWVELVYKDNIIIEHIIIKLYIDLKNKIPGSICIETKPNTFIPVIDLWNNWKYRREYRKIVFEPGVKNEKNLNLFTGFKFKRDDTFEIDEDKIEKVLFHCKNVLSDGNEEVYEYFLDIFAWILQYPNKRLGIAIICKSIQGVGKNLFFEHFFGEKIIGRHAICVADPDQVVGKFNSSMEGKVYTVVNELKSEGNCKKQSSLLKSLITDITNKIERKGIDAITIGNKNNYVFLTNDDNTLCIDVDDRRYLCIKASGKYKNPEYFSILIDNMKDENAEHFFHYLMNRDVENLMRSKIPLTKYKVELMMSSVNNIIKWFNDYIIKQKIDIMEPPDEFIQYRIDELYSNYKEYISDGSKYQKQNFLVRLIDIDNGIKAKVDNDRNYIQLNWKEVIEDMKIKNILF